MYLVKQLTSEQLPKNEVTDFLKPQVEDSPEEHKEWFDKVENILLDKGRAGITDAYFCLGQLYFSHKMYSKARQYFLRVQDKDYRAMFQLGVIYYDGLDVIPDYTLGVNLMMRIVQSSDPKACELKYAAQYNIARAFLQGFGVKRRSEEEAERWLLQAADDGNPKASVKAQTVLGLFYASANTNPEFCSIKKSFFWHSEACGNGSVESQGCLGVMYESGVGTEKNVAAAFDCYREAAERGNVFAMGHLVASYYKRKMFTKCIELATRVTGIDDVAKVAEATDCLPQFICKGVSMSCFYYALCLQRGLAIKQDRDAAARYFSKSFKFDPDTCAQLQSLVQIGKI